MRYHVVAKNRSTGKYEAVTDRPFLLEENAREVRDRIDADRDPHTVYDSRGIDAYLADKNAALSST